MSVVHRSKYGAKRCSEHTPSHASLKECRRAGELRLLERVGQICGLREQVRMNLCDGNCRHKRPITYVADFVFEERVDGDKWRLVIEDCKGVETPVFKLKKHILEDQGMELRIT